MHPHPHLHLHLHLHPHPHPHLQRHYRTRSNAPHSIFSCWHAHRPGKAKSSPDKKRCPTEASRNITREVKRSNLVGGDHHGRDPRPSIQDLRTDVRDRLRQRKACPVCPDRQKHHTASCRVAETWNGKKTSWSRAAKERIINNCGAAICSD